MPVRCAGDVEHRVNVIWDPHRNRPHVTDGVFLLARHDNSVAPLVCSMNSATVYTDGVRSVQSLSQGLWQEVVDLLGWRGALLHGLDLLGDRVSVVASRGSGTAAPEIVLSGVIAHRANWKVGMRAAAGFVAFAPRAIVVTETKAHSSYLLTTAIHTGVGVVVVVDGHPVVLHSPAPLRPRRRTVGHDLVEASVHARLASDAACGVY